jgi:hypothetical protein
MRAQAYIGESRNDLALKDVEQALKLNPNDREAANLKGQLQGGTQRNAQTFSGDVPYSCKKTYATMTPTPDGRALGYNDQRKDVQGSFNLSVNASSSEIIYYPYPGRLDGFTREHFSIAADDITWNWAGMSAPTVRYPNETRGLAYLSAPTSKLSRSDGSFVLIVEYNFFTETNYASCTKSQ